MPLSHRKMQSEPSPGMQVNLSGRMLARNTLLNLAGTIVPMAAAVFAAPYVIHHLGPDRYGLFSLASIVVGYFALINLGIGPATTKYVAELLGKGELERLPEQLWTAVTIQTCLGMVGGLLLAAASPFLVEHVLKIPADLHSQARTIFFTMAFALPIDFVAGSFRGVLTAAQRFDLLNAVSIPLGAIMSVMPAVAIALGFGLPAIVFLLLMFRVVSITIIIVQCFRLFPTLRSIRFDFRLIRSLLGYGGWITISGAANPLLIYFDQFLIGALQSVAAVGYYAPPFNLANKLNILPQCLSSTLFPAFSASAGRGDSDWIRKSLTRSLKFLILIVGPTSLLLAFFARPLLTIWLGPKFGNEGARPLQILAAGVLINSLAFIPYGLLQGVGRPDLTAKFHIIEVPIHIGLVWFLVTRFGLPGAALAWTLRVSLDFVLLMVAACWITRTPARLLAASDLRRSVGTLAVLGLALLLLWSSTHIFLAEAAISLLLSGGFLIAAWRYVLNLDERGQIRLWLRLAR